MSFTKAGALVMLYGFGGLSFALASHLFVKRLGEKGLTSRGGLFVTVSLLAGIAVYRPRPLYKPLLRHGFSQKALVILRKNGESHFPRNSD